VAPDGQSGSMPMSMPGMPPIANPSEIGWNSEDLASENGIEMERPPSVSVESREKLAHEHRSVSEAGEWQ
jgi:hypothetical protein